MFTVLQATPEDFEWVDGFYRRMIDVMPGTEYDVKWSDDHPTREFLQEALEAGEAYIGVIIGEEPDTGCETAGAQCNCPSCAYMRQVAQGSGKHRAHSSKVPAEVHGYEGYEGHESHERQEGHGRHARHEGHEGHAGHESREGHAGHEGHADVHEGQERVHEDAHQHDFNPVVAAFVLDHEAAPGFEDIPWEVEGEPGEIGVIQLLGVLPEYHGRGYATQLMRKAIEEARRKGMKAIRLDVLSHNERAMGLYEKMGFKKLGVFPLYFPELGETRFAIYELKL